MSQALIGGKAQFSLGRHSISKNFITVGLVYFKINSFLPFLDVRVLVVDVAEKLT